MKNKKAGIFAVGMVLGMIIFIGIAWYAFSSTNKNINSGIEISDATNYKNLQNTFSFYMNGVAKLSSTQSFYDIAKQAAINKENSNCNVYSEKNYFMWSSDCKPEQQFIEDLFVEKYNQSFYDFLQKYPESGFESGFELQKIEYIHNLEEEIIKSTAPIKVLKTEKATAFATYNISYNLNPIINLNLSEQEIYLDDFIDIYHTTNLAVQECKEQQNPEICIKNKLNFKRWTTKIQKSSSNFIFELKTNKYFFFKDSEGRQDFKQIKLNFVMIV